MSRPAGADATGRNDARHLVARVNHLAAMAALTALLAAEPGSAFNLFQPDLANTNPDDYVLEAPPDDPPPFLHWDLREFPGCSIPWSMAFPVPDLDFETGANDVNDQAAAQTAFGNAFGAWEGLPPNPNPAVIGFAFQAAGAPPPTGIAFDETNLMSFDEVNQDDQQCTLVGNPPAPPGYVVIAPGADNVLTTAPDGDDMVVPCVVDGGNGTSDTPAAGTDVQVVAVGNPVGGCSAVVVASADTTLETLPVADDEESFCIVDGPNGESDTTANNNAFGGFGFGGSLALTGIFLNNQRGVILESDVIFDPAEVWSTGAHGQVPVEVIVAGGDFDADSGPPVNDDTQSIAAGTVGLPWHAVVIGPGPDGVIDTPAAAGDLQRQTADLQTIATHEIGHMLGIAHAAGAGDINPAGPIMNPDYARGLANNHLLAQDDLDALNFLYTPDLGDAPDPLVATFNEYPSKVHGSDASRTLNGVQLYNPASGAEHLFGFFGSAATPRYQYEWLGDTASGQIDDSPLECVAQVPDADDFDDGVTFGGSFQAGGPAVPVTFHVRTAEDINAGKHNYPVDSPMYINAWFDWNADGDWPFVTDHMVIGLMVRDTDLTDGEALITVDVAAPADALPGGWARVRLDWKENVGYASGMLSSIDGTLEDTRGAAQFGEVEDFPIPWPIDWSNPLGGDFEVGGNWVGGSAAGVDDVARFAIAQTYNVFLNQNEETLGLEVSNGDQLTLALQNNLYEVTNFTRVYADSLLRISGFPGTGGTLRTKDLLIDDDSTLDVWERAVLVTTNRVIIEAGDEVGPGPHIKIDDNSMWRHAGAIAPVLENGTTLELSGFSALLESHAGLSTAAGVEARITGIGEIDVGTNKLTIDSGGIVDLGGGQVTYLTVTGDYEQKAGATLEIHDDATLETTNSVILEAGDGVDPGPHIKINDNATWSHTGAIAPVLQKGTTLELGGPAALLESDAGLSTAAGVEARITGIGEIDVGTNKLTIESGGIVDVGGDTFGTLIVNGDYEQKAGATLEIDIGPEGWDKLDVRGNFEVGGSTLKLRFHFIPLLNEVFQIIIFPEELRELAAAGTEFGQIDVPPGFGVEYNPETGEITVTKVPANIPTLSQWGLILFGMLLLTAMFVVIRRRGLPAHMTASLLLLGAVGLAAATAAYAQIQSERVCSESDVAVEFVTDLLNS